MTDLTELNKLEKYLKQNGIKYERIDSEKTYDANGMLIKLERHQIFVPCEDESEWDVICHPGSYGYEEGLLEIYGSLVTEEDGDSVAGHLTADDVIKRIEKEKKQMAKNKLFMTSEEYEEECGPILFEIADNLRIIAGQLAELNGYIPLEEQTSDYECTMDVDDLPDAIKELFDPKEGIDFMDAVVEAQKKGNHHFQCPNCGGSAEWHEARTNGHLHAWCNKCGIKLFE